MTKKFYTPIHTLRALQAQSAKNKAAVAYLRQADEENLSAQLAQIEVCAAQDGLTLAKIYSDPVVSKHQNGLLELLKDAPQGRFKAVYVQKVERLSCQVKTAVAIAKKLKQAGVTLKIVEPNVDLDTKAGKVGFQMLAVAAEICAQRGVQKLTEPKTKQDAQELFQKVHETFDQTTLEGQVASTFVDFLGAFYVHGFDKIHAIEA